MSDAPPVPLPPPGEAEYRCLFDLIDEGVCFLEWLPRPAEGLRDYRYLAVNRAMRELLGVGDLTGRTVRECLPHEADVWAARCDRVLETGEPVRFEWETAPGGTMLSVFVSRVPEGNGRRLVAVVRSVTAQERAAVETDVSKPPTTTTELSEREVEVVRFIARGYSNKEIAARLNLSVKTVETYKARSMEKLGIRTRVGLVQYAAERGWLTLP